MVGLSVHGLLGIDSELAQSAMAARQQEPVTYHSVQYTHHHHGDCGAAPASKRI